MHVEELKEKLEEWPYPLITDEEVVFDLTGLAPLLYERSDQIYAILKRLSDVISLVDSKERSEIKSTLNQISDDLWEVWQSSPI